MSYETCELEAHQLRWGDIFEEVAGTWREVEKIDVQRADIDLATTRIRIAVQCRGASQSTYCDQHQRLSVLRPGVPGPDPAVGIHPDVVRAAASVIASLEQAETALAEATSPGYHLGDSTIAISIDDTGPCATLRWVDDGWHLFPGAP